MEKLDNVDARVTELESRVDALVANVSKLEKTCEHLNSLVAGIAETIGEDNLE